MVLTADVKITRYGSPGYHEPMAQPIGASVTLYAGSFAVTDDTTGKLKNAATCDSADVCWGVIARQQIAPATGTMVPIETGSFYFAASTGADALTQANIGGTVYIFDEVTVAATNSGSRCTAGILVNIDTTQPGGYAVKVGSASSSGGGT